MGKLRLLPVLLALAACAPQAPPPESVSLAAHVPFAVAGGPPVRVSVRVRDADGNPLLRPLPRLEVSVGTVGDAIEQPGGFFDFTYRPPSRAPGGRVTLTASASAGEVRRSAELVLPIHPQVKMSHVDGLVTVETVMTVMTRGKALGLAVNVGEISPLRPGSREGTFLADYSPPREPGPRRVLFELRDRGVLIGSLSFPIVAKRTITIDSEPGATLVAQLGKKEVARIPVGDDGRVSFPVEVGPDGSIHDLVVVVTDPAVRARHLQ